MQVKKAKFKTLIKRLPQDGIQALAPLTEQKYSLKFKMKKAEGDDEEGED